MLKADFFTVCMEESEGGEEAELLTSVLQNCEDL